MARQRWQVRAIHRLSMSSKALVVYLARRLVSRQRWVVQTPVRALIAKRATTLVKQQLGASGDRSVPAQGRIPVSVAVLPSMT